MERKCLAIVVPVYNEMESIRLFWDALTVVLRSMSESHEVIFVNDGSTDGTLEILKSFVDHDVQVVNLLVNSGHMAALDAGLRATNAEFAITLDADLQHPPGEIPGMLSLAKEGAFDVVYAVRVERNEDKFFKRFTASIYYRIVRNLSGIPLHQNAADFRLISSTVLGVIKSLPPRAHVFRLLIPKLGFSATTYPYVAAERIAGKSKYGIGKMVQLGVLSVVSFSSRPLIFSVYLGALFSLLSVLGVGYSLVQFAIGNTIPGWASISTVLFLLFGILFFVLGITGTYLAEIWRRTSGIPAYFVENLDPFSHIEAKDGSE